MVPLTVKACLFSELTLRSHFGAILFNCSTSLLAPAAPAAGAMASTGSAPDGSSSTLGGLKETCEDAVASAARGALVLRRTAAAAASAAREIDAAATLAEASSDCARAAFEAVPQAFLVGYPKATASQRGAAAAASRGMGASDSAAVALGAAKEVKEATTALLRSLEAAVTLTKEAAAAAEEAAFCAEVAWTSLVRRA